MENQPQTQVPVVEGGRSWRKTLLEFASSKRLIVFAAVLGIEIALLFGAMLVPIAPAEQQVLGNEASTLANTTASAGFFGTIFLIFQNNLRIALIEMIPILGAVAFLESIFVTGQIIEVIGMRRSVPGPLLGGALFLFPFTFVELSSYAIAVSSGSLLLLSTARQRAVAEARVFVLQIGVVVLLLLLAATMETITDYAPVVGLALWIPAILAAVLVERSLRRIRRI